MFKKHKKYYGFTLVELIIVITILSILATISFVSFSGYTANSRDSNRLFSLKEISKSLTMQKEITGNFPQPDEVYAKGGIPNLDNELFSVGLIGKNVSNYVKLGGIPLDPKTGSEYLYGLTRDNKNFQIAGTLENLQSSIIIEKAYADAGMQAVVEGDYKGVIRFTHDNKNYIGNIPSLIFSRNGTYIELKTFVINKGKNLPYSLDGKNLGTGLTPELVLKELHNKDNLVLTGVVITNPKSETEIKQISDKLGVSDVIIADSLGNKQYASSGGSSGGGTQNKPTLTCPTGYILVPGNSTFSTKDFCVMKYEAKINGNDNGSSNYNSSFYPESRPNGTPGVYLTSEQAIQSCDKLNSDGTKKFHLITNNEWMTIARNIELIGDNWTGKSTGSGTLYIGHTDNTPYGGQASNQDDSNGFFNTSNSSGNQKRTLILSNGEIIWDFSGNVGEYVNNTNDFNSNDGKVINGVVCTGSNNYYSWINDGIFTQCSFLNGFNKDKYGPVGNYSVLLGIGNINSGDLVSDKSLLRGGYFSYGYPLPGIYSLITESLSYKSINYGFRCVYSNN